MVDRCYAFLGAWLRAGEGIGWLAAGNIPNSLYRMPLVYLFLACVFCYSCSFLFVVFCVLVFFFCSHWSLVDVPLIFFCPADHVPDWQPRILLGMVEARSVNVKKTTTKNNNNQEGSKSRQKVMRFYKQWHRPISKRFIKPPYYFISRATSIDSECCRLPRTSVLSKKRKKYTPTSFDQQVQVSQGHAHIVQK